MPDESDDNSLPEEGFPGTEPGTEDNAAPPAGDAVVAAAAGSTDAAPGPAESALPWEMPLPPERAAAALPPYAEGAAAPAGPWPPHDDPATEPAANEDGGGTPETAAAPTRAEWRQLADEVRRLAAQIAHGRA